MPLTPGTGFGSYHIAEIIGVGGMGEVYRATDASLKREVAIKALPDSFVDDAGRLARFQREAELLAALNHPNVGQIYGIEKTGTVSALILELVEGPTLAERIAQGPIPVDEALRIAGQIAEALEAAHAKGIVHRDLKPANVKLREDGVVKVLDFGIAKAVEPAAAGDTGPTPETPPPAAMTEAGAVVGTLGYMAPEQARGRPIDKRTDIFAFGAVFYEMLTGQPPFFGEDATEMIAAVLKSDPDWDALPELPPLVATFLKQCLKKDPADRIHDIADVRLALAGRYELSVAAEAKGRGSWAAWPVRAAGVAALIVVAAAAGWLAGPASAPAPGTGVETYAVGPPVAAPLLTGGDRIVAASPDGKRLAYLSDGSVWLQTLGRQDAAPIARGRQPFFSPDGEWIAFVSDGPALAKASIYDHVPVEMHPLPTRDDFSAARGTATRLSSPPRMVSIGSRRPTKPEGRRSCCRRRRTATTPGRSSCRAADRFF